jgi:hypothetical protein
MKIESKTDLTLGGKISGFFRRKIPHLRKPNWLVDPIKISLGIVLLATLTGCVGYVDGGYGGGGVVVAEPDLVVFGGGDYGRGHDVHGYSQRGSASRAVAHSSGGGHARDGGRR